MRQREEPVATVSSWTPTAEPRYVETVVAPPTPAEVAAAQARGELPQRRQEQEQEQEQQQATRVSDFSSLYSATPHRGVSEKILARFDMVWWLSLGGGRGRERA